MKISDILSERRSVSFEFYPPKEATGIPSVFRAIDRLKPYRPDFISVTYGAGGSTRAFTEEIAVGANEDPDLVVMAHITCSSQTKEDVHSVLKRLDAVGIENVIALRGDPPRDQPRFVPAVDGFAHATDLIQHIREGFDFGIAAACYPEGHPESPDLDSDLEYVKMKVDLGAELLITQLFYDNSDFYSFMEKVEKVNIRVPVVAGVLPVISASQARRFTAACGASIPPRLSDLLDRFADDDGAMRQAGVEYATEQVRDLWDNGVAGVHFYALNRSYSISGILNNLGIPGHSAE